jgi:hypothetical protein
LLVTKTPISGDELVLEKLPRVSIPVFKTRDGCKPLQTNRSINYIVGAEVIGYKDRLAKSAPLKNSKQTKVKKANPASKPAKV